MIRVGATAVLLMAPPLGRRMTRARGPDRLIFVSGRPVPGRGCGPARPAGAPPTDVPAYIWRGMAAGRGLSSRNLLLTLERPSAAMAARTARMTPAKRRVDRSQAARKETERAAAVFRQSLRLPAQQPRVDHRSVVIA